MACIVSHLNATNSLHDHFLQASSACHLSWRMPLLMAAVLSVAWSRLGISQTREISLRFQIALSACELCRVWLGICDPLAVTMYPASTLVAAQHALSVIVCDATMACHHPVSLSSSMAKLLVTQVQSWASNYDVHLQHMHPL